MYDNLCLNFAKSKVFMDVDAIPAGAEFVQYIVGVISSSDVLLAVIGPHWQELKDAKGMRTLDDETDVVRLEIQTALAKKVKIVPILVDAARMPTADALPERRQVLLFEKESITKNNTTVEGQTRLGAIPADEFIDCMSIRLLGTRRCQRVQNCVL